MKAFAIAAVLSMATLACLRPPEVFAPDVYLVMDALGNGHGSAVAIGNGFALTCKHVDNAAFLGPFMVAGRIDHPTLDLSILFVPGLVADFAGFGKLPDVFDPVSAYGWHLAECLLRTDGFQGLRTEEMSAPIIFGCSGGAVVDVNGQLVGIISAVAVAQTMRGDSHAVSHMARYTPLSRGVISWIEENT